MSQPVIEIQQVTEIPDYVPVGSAIIFIAPYNFINQTTKEQLPYNEENVDGDDLAVWLKTPKRIYRLVDLKRDQNIQYQSAKNKPNGYAGLNDLGKLLTELFDEDVVLLKKEIGKINGVVPLNSVALIPDHFIPFAIERIARKEQPNGYPGLDENRLINPERISNLFLRRTELNNSFGVLGLNENARANKNYLPEDIMYADSLLNGVQRNNLFTQLRKQFLDSIFKIGHIYENLLDGRNPSEILDWEESTWENQPAGLVLVSEGTALAGNQFEQTIFFPISDKKGKDRHIHNLLIPNAGWNVGTTPIKTSEKGHNIVGSGNEELNETLESLAHSSDRTLQTDETNNLPPYQVVYRWVRVA